MDIIKKWFLRIDIEREFDTPIIELYMQDVKTNLFITTLTNNGARISLKDYNIVTLNVLKADDTRLVVSGKVTEDGNVIFEMDSQATSVKGICSATIRIYEGDSSVTSKPFYFSVIDDPYRGTDNSIVSQNSYTALQDILSQTAKALEEAVKVNDYFKINLPTVKELISYEPILKDIVKNKDEAKELIRESKNLQVKIDASMADLKRLEGLIPEVNRLVDKGNETIRALTNATESVSETIARADTKRADLEGILAMFKDIDEKAQRIKDMSDEVNTLLPKLDEARSVKSGLDSTIASAKSNKTDLEKSITSAGDIDRSLGSKINQSKTLSNNLKADIENAKNTNSTLNSDREAASLMVTELKNTKNDADTINSELNSAQIKASSTKDELDKLVTDANKTTNEAKGINTALKETNSKAESNKLNLDKANAKAESLKDDLGANTSLAEGVDDKLKTNTDLANKSNRNLELNKSLADDSLLRLKDLLDKTSNLEYSLKEIIASGDLSKYVTDPKLQEALKSYATKDDLSKIDVTGQLVDYVKKAEGKGLSSNDYTDTDKAKVDAIPPNPKYTDTTYDLSGYATKTDLQGIDVTGQLVDYAKKTDLNNKVDKVNGKDLSSNDYTDADKAKVDAIPSNPKYTDTTYDLSGYAKKTDVKTKLSEMAGDSTHRTVTDAEKQSWNKKFDLPDGKENQVLTKTTNGAEFKNLSRSATFVIANYDSSESSKAGADYVIQENDCVAEIINNFITKLPEYGGKIQLTEGNFSIKKNLSINFTKNNIIIEGYGDSTNIIDKLTEDERDSVIVMIANEVEHCRLSYLNITHDTNTSIHIKGNKNYIKNVNTINNDEHYPSIAINKSRDNTIESCSVNSMNICYYILGAAKNNKILNCSGTSTLYQVFLIDGSENSLVVCKAESNTKGDYPCFHINSSNTSLSNCTGTSTNHHAFYINSSNTSLSNCTGTSTNNHAFYIRGSGISLIGCKGETKNPNKCYDISLASGTKSCIVLGNFYHAGRLDNKGTNNAVANNVKLEV